MHILESERPPKPHPDAHYFKVAERLYEADQELEALALASLDVVSPEPLPEGHWLYSHARVRLSPHISWSAPGALEELLVPFLTNLRHFLQGEPLEGLVDVELGY